MEELCICKICKKVFTDPAGLNKHKMAQHPQKQSTIQASNNNKDITHQFRNNSNISITRIQKESNSVSQSSTMSQNQNSFRKSAVTVTPSITVRREAKPAKPTEGVRVRPPFRNPEGRAKGTESSTRLMVMGDAPDVDDDTSDWRAWEPLSKDRDSVTTSVVPSNATGRPSGGAIITAKAAEIASTALNSATATTARKSVPQLLRVVPAGGPGKRPAPGSGSKGNPNPQRNPTPASATARGAAPASAVAGIMQNLGKMKSMNQQATARVPPTPNQKMISIPQNKKTAAAAALSIPAKVQKSSVQQRLVVNKPPPKTKPNAVSKSASNNVLPKPAAGQASKKPVKPAAAPPEEDDSEDSSSSQDDDNEEEEENPRTNLSALIVQQRQAAKKPLPNIKPVVTGKAPPPSKSLSTNRFNPIDTSPNKKVKKPAPVPVSKGSPGGKSKATGNAAATATSSTNGTNRPATASTSTSSNSVVAKKSAPPKKKGKEDHVSKLKAYVPGMPGTDYDMPRLSAIGSYTNRAGQQVWVCLVCNEKEHEESSRDMICCETCEDWYHWECVGIRQAMKEEDPWYCKRCIYQASSNPKKDFPRIFRNDVLEGC